MPFNKLQSAALGGPRVASPVDRRKRAGRVAGLAGRSAEERVRRWYERRGATILAERWRAGRDFGGGELDLVAREGDAIVFVEVKARRTCALAAEAITPAQWRRLEAAALRFMVDAKTGEADMRFDVALCGRDGFMEVIENARMM